MLVLRFSGKSVGLPGPTKHTAHTYGFGRGAFAEAHNPASV
jgi:hypothetical protein